jgi:hypothetical protein
MLDGQSIREVRFIRMKLAVLQVSKGPQMEKKIRLVLSDVVIIGLVVAKITVA